MEIEVTEPQTEEEWEQHYRLRWERLRRDHGEPFGSERDSPQEARSTHLIAKVDGRVVGAEAHAFFERREGRLRRRRKVVRTRQIAVHPDFERSGVAGALIDRVEEEGRQAGAYWLIGNVRETAIPWALARGAVIIGEGTPVYGVPGVAIRIRL